jgi:protein involved in polysaccharide export with SLBB domain
MSMSDFFRRLSDRRRCGRRKNLLALTICAVAATSLGSHWSWSKDQEQTVGDDETAAFVERPAPYVLGPNDKLRVRVVEWRQSQSEVFEWKVLNQDYIIDADGSVSLPLVGDIPAAGQTRTALGQTIGERLRANLRLDSSINVIVEVVECRPFYVMGNVNKPGEYHYRPGMTVLQAVSIAGGYLRNLDPRTEVIDENEMRGAVGVLSELAARKERLTAELNGKPLQYSPQLKQQNDPLMQVNLVQEERIFDANREAESKELRSLQDLEDFYNQWITMLGSQMQVNAKTIALSNAQMHDVTSLLANGLTTRRREFEATLQSTQVQSEALRLQSELVKARQELSKTKIDITQIESKRATRAATELRDTQAEINEMERKFALKAKLLIYAGDEGAVQRTFRILRRTAAGAKELVVAEGERIQPGDVLEVNFEPRAVPDVAIIHEFTSSAAAASNATSTHE